MNTGFGGSANTRTNAVEELQKNLLRMLQFGITSENRPVKSTARVRRNHGLKEVIRQSALPLDDPVAATSMPESWVRAAMLIRLNSLASGVSGVKESTIRALHEVLEAEITPQVPIKGSISASGDLSPLSYIGGVIQGKPGLNVWTRDSRGERRLQRSDVALAERSVKPVTLGPKEGLALVNGTAVSCAVGTLALHDALGQAALAQVLTAMTVEALCGTDESFDPFFAKVRPHPGQIEAAQNIFGFLSQSSLVQHSDTGEGELRQDRYSVRTASQWIGPVLEDLHLAHQQLTIEINSTTDNPLIDPHQDGKMMHGGNFQARAVTSAMEKSRLALQTIGRMLFAQCTELINPATNRGLPPNLAAGEPSDSFIWKGTDILIAALQAELGFLANPVGSHVQTAEMGNQAINSLALISGRYTLEAVQTLSQLSSAHLVATCQALDIRAMNIKFMAALAIPFNDMVEEAFSKHLRATSSLKALQESLWAVFEKSLDTLTHFDSPKRFASATEALQPLILKHLPASTESMSAVSSWTERSASKTLEIFCRERDQYCTHPDATPYIGIASRRMYQFLREAVGVPFIGNEIITTPSDEFGRFNWGEEGMAQDSRKGTTMGTMTSKVFETMRTGELYHVVMDCVADVSVDDDVDDKRFAELDKAQQSAVPTEESSKSGDSETRSRDEKGEFSPAAQSRASKATTVVDPDEVYQYDPKGNVRDFSKVIDVEPESHNDLPVHFKAVDLDGDVVRVQEVVDA